ncbi:MAG TPA: transcriptional regulator [Methanophagales archaeon]|nr:transcriptional regulator [Methanophagales archaeon]
MNIRKIIEEGESETLEFKEKFERETIETAVAFSNSKGGMILIGISDKGEVKGVSVGKGTLKEWINKIFQSTEPTLITDAGIHEIEDRTIVAIIVEESPIKPISYKGACYLRIENSNGKLTPKEVAELYLQTIGSSWDSYSARDGGLEDMDLEKVKEYIKFANESGRRKIKEKPLEVLKKLELIKYNKPTWATILLFGKEPQGFISQAKVHCGRFKDETTIVNDEMVGGSLFEQIEKVMDFIKKSIGVKFVITGKPRREEIWEYPLDALREAVINAVVHRDYTEPSETQVRVYDDKLIVWNSGKLPLGITLEDLFKPHKSVLRNKLIAQVFYDVGFIEQWGTGIRRMIDSCSKQGLPEPKFEEYQGFRVIFSKFYIPEDVEKELNERQRGLIEVIKKKGEVALNDYKKLFPNFAERTLRNDLEDLVKHGVLTPRGERKGRRYILAAISAKYRQNIGK